MSTSTQLGGHLDEVVDLTVRHHMDVAALVRERLITRFEIDDRKPTRAEDRVAMLQEAFAVRSPMRESTNGRSHDICPLHCARAVETRDSTHAAMLPQTRHRAAGSIRSEHIPSRGKPMPVNLAEMRPPRTRRIAVIAGYAPSLVLFRGPLLRTLVTAGHDVVALAPPAPKWTERIESLGVTFHPVPFSRAGVDPLGDLRAARVIEALLRRERLDTVLAYTIKPVVIGIPAAARTGASVRVALVTGLGYTFGTENARQRAVGVAARWLYRRALRSATAVLFQNPDDRSEFVHRGLVAEAKVDVVSGSGVDLDRFPFSDPPSRPGVRFLLIARLLVDKGIREYVQAARTLRPEHPDWEFHLVGPSDPNPMAITDAELATWQAEGVVTIHPATDDVRPHLAACGVYVLPSYREGTPRTVLEAMATGRPIITTDAPGCRETTTDGDNGLVVPVKDVQSLVAAMRRLGLDPTLRSRMGRRSREIAEQTYDVRTVNQDMMRAMELVT